MLPFRIQYFFQPSCVIIILLRHLLLKMQYIFHAIYFIIIHWLLYSEYHCFLKWVMSSSFTYVIIQNKFAFPRNLRHHHTIKSSFKIWFISPMIYIVIIIYIYGIIQYILKVCVRYKGVPLFFTFLLKMSKSSYLSTFFKTVKKVHFHKI